MSASTTPSLPSVTAPQMLGRAQQLLKTLEESGSKGCKEFVDLNRLSPSYPKHLAGFQAQLTNLAAASKLNTDKGSSKYNHELSALLGNPVIGPMLEAYLKQFTARAEDMLQKAAMQYDHAAVHQLAKSMGLSCAATTASGAYETFAKRVLENPSESLSTVIVPGVGLFTSQNIFNHFCAAMIDPKEGAAHRWMIDDAAQPDKARDLAELTRIKYYDHPIEYAEQRLQEIATLLESGAVNKLPPVVESSWSLASYLPYIQTKDNKSDKQSDYDRLCQVQTQLTDTVSALRKQRDAFVTEMKTSSDAFLRRSQILSVKSFMSDVKAPIKAFLSECGYPSTSYKKTFSRMTASSSSEPAKALQQSQSHFGKGIQNMTSVILPNAIQHGLQWGITVLSRAGGWMEQRAEEYQFQQDIKSQRARTFEEARNVRQHCALNDDSDVTNKLRMLSTDNNASTISLPASIGVKEEQLREDFLAECGQATEERSAKLFCSTTPAHKLSELQHIDYWALSRDLARDLLGIGTVFGLGAGVIWAASSALPDLFGKNAAVEDALSDFSCDDLASSTIVSTHLSDMNATRLAQAVSACESTWQVRADLHNQVSRKTSLSEQYSTLQKALAEQEHVRQTANIAYQSAKTLQEKGETLAKRVTAHDASLQKLGEAQQLAEQSLGETNVSYLAAVRMRDEKVKDEQRAGSQILDTQDSVLRAKNAVASANDRVDSLQSEQSALLSKRAALQKQQDALEEGSYLINREAEQAENAHSQAIANVDRLATQMKQFDVEQLQLLLPVLTAEYEKAVDELRVASGKFDGDKFLAELNAPQNARTVSPATLQAEANRVELLEKAMFAKNAVLHTTEINLKKVQADIRSYESLKKEMESRQDLERERKGASQSAAARAASHQKEIKAASESLDGLDIEIVRSDESIKIAKDGLKEADAVVLRQQSALDSARQAYLTLRDIVRTSESSVSNARTQLHRAQKKVAFTLNRIQDVESMASQAKRELSENRAELDGMSSLQELEKAVSASTEHISKLEAQVKEISEALNRAESAIQDGTQRAVYHGACLNGLLTCPDSLFTSRSVTREIEDELEKRVNLVSASGHAL